MDGCAYCEGCGSIAYKSVANRIEMKSNGGHPLVALKLTRIRLVNRNRGEKLSVDLDCRPQGF